MIPDIQKYLRHFEGHNLSNAEKEELALTLWKTLELLVDRMLDGGLEIHEVVAKDETGTGRVLQFTKRISDYPALSGTFSDASEPEEGRQDD